MAKTKQTEGAKLLAAWIGKRSQVSVAAQLGVSPMRLNHWIRGRSVPRMSQAFAIETATRGAVPAKEWLR